MRKKINRKAIAVIHLQQDISVGSLKTRAISEVIAKTLYQNDSDPLSLTRLISKAEGLTMLPGISQKLASDGLMWLKGNGWAEEVTKGWRLTQPGKRIIDTRHDESEARILYLLKKHFGASIDEVKLRGWFLEASTAFFAEFGEVISRSLLRENITLPKRESLESILFNSIGNCGLGEEKDILIKGFHDFLNDTEPRAEQQKMSFAVATLSARLISAANGPDPIALPEFEKSKLFLDTNVLLLERVEMNNPDMAFALTALAKALDSIGATLHIIKLTQDEYKSVVARKQSEALKVLKEGVSFGVLQKSGDTFLKKAISNGAKNEADLVSFFESIQNPPTSIGAVPIDILDYPELNEKINNALKDGKKTAEISAEWKRLRGKEKKEVLAEHDAALEAAVSYIRSEEGKGWVISRDKSMLNLSKRWHEKSDMPSWVYLQALVEILAVYGTGPLYKSEDFAPLLGALIRSDVQETFAEFQLEDLGELADIDARVFELTDDEVVGFAQKMHQIRLTGDDKQSEIQLEIKRKFQGRRLQDNIAAQEARAETVTRQKQIELGREIAIASLAKNLIPKVKNNRFWAKMRTLLPWIIAGVLTILAIVILQKKSDSQTWVSTLVALLVAEVIIPFLIFIFRKTSGPTVQEEAKALAEIELSKEENLRK